VVAGGHTVRDVEIKYGLSVTGVVTPERLVTNRQAQPGDLLVLTKPLGTGFVTTASKAGRCPDQTLQAACDSMIQLNVIGRDAGRASAAHAATDVTGFGLAGHAGEMAEASGVTIVLEIQRLPILLGAAALAQAGNRTRASRTNREYTQPFTRIEGAPDSLLTEFLFDPQTSGGLLLSVPADQAEVAVREARDRGATHACVVGTVVEQTAERLILRP
jgi:selenide,water dikinase